MILPRPSSKSSLSILILRISFASAASFPYGTNQGSQSVAPALRKFEQSIVARPDVGRPTLRSFARSLRGGGDEAPPSSVKYETLARPAEGTPFHYAFPVHDLEAAKRFYSEVLGCAEGRSSTKWQDYSLHGHQIVCHWVGNDYRCVDYFNPVDGDEVPVPHAGLALTVEQFHELAERVEAAGIEFIIPPHLRFEGMPGEQYTMFFKDPSGNNLEFKAMTRPENLFAKYNVADK